MGNLVFIRQRGVALITVMLIVALAAIIAAQMTTRLQMQMQRNSNASFNQQAYWYAMAAESFSKRLLMTSFKDEREVTHLDQLWAQGETTYPVDFGEISGEITDLHSCFNLNALRIDRNKSLNTSESQTTKQFPARAVFEQLIESLAIEGISSFEAEAMADALTDWLDSDGFISGTGGAEDDDYASREFPYLTANNYLSSVSELRVIEHFSPRVIEALRPYVCVLEQNNTLKVNVNTLDVEKPELLQALLDSSLEEAQQVLTARGEEGFNTLDDFYNAPEMSQMKLTEEQKKQFVVDSEFFKLKARASFNESYFTLNSVLKVAENQQIYTISRTIGRN